MFRHILKFILICLVASLVFFVYAIYRDIRINKLFNYSLGLKNVSLRENYYFEGQTKKIEYVIDFIASDNYLGAVHLPVKSLGETEGDVIFQIRDKKSNRLIHKNIYDYNYFNNINSHIFGFPVIDDSKDNNYTVSLLFTSKDINLDDQIVTLDNNKDIYAKYVFPRKTIVESPVKFLNIIKYRIVFAFVDLNNVKIFSYIIIFSLLTVIVSNSLFYKNYFLSVKHLKRLFAVIFTPKFNLVLYLMALLILVVMVILIFFNNMTKAENMPEYIWVLLFAASVWFIITKLRILFFNSFVVISRKIWMNLLTVFSDKTTGRYAFVVCIIILTIFSGLKKYYILGGDDTRLFYLYPIQFLNNYSLKIVSDVSLSGIGTSITTATIPLVMFMVILKNIVGTLNLQSIFYTANIVGGIVAFLLLANILLPSKKKYSNIIKIISSFAYVFSIYNAYTLYNSKLVSIYLISIFPLVFYLFIRSLKTNNPLLLVVISIISSVFSLLFLSLPWFLATLIGLIPLIMYCLWRYKFRAVKHSIILLLLLLVLNFHWLFFLRNSSIIGGGRGIVKNGITSTEYKSKNSIGIRQVSELNSVFYPLLNIYNRNIVENFSWANLPILSNWSLKMLPFNIFFLCVFIIAGLLNRNGSTKILYVTLVSSFLTSVYFYTVNITSWGIEIFVWLNNNIPGFVMFRNMYDKFAYVTSLSFALLLAISLQVVVDNIKNKKKIAYLITLAGFCVFLNIKPLVFGEYGKLPIWTAHNTFDSTESFNDDFLDLVKYIRSVDDPGKYLILPLSSGNTFPVEDKFQNNHYYNGVSPLLVLTGKNDFSGLLSFREISDDVLDSVKNKDYVKLGKILQKLNVKYVIVNHAINDELKNSYVFSEGIFFLQDENMMAQVTGEKIEDFGNRYSLYRINEKYDSEKIFLTSNAEIISNNTNLTYKKVNTYLYEITINDFEGSNNLIFLDPYQEGWKLSDENGNSVQNAHFIALGYANGWKLDLSANKQTSINLKLYYQPYKYFWIINTVSISGYLFCFVIILKGVVDRKHNERNI